MQEQIDLALRYARMVWRYRWLAIVSAMAVCLAGWAAVVLLPDEYEVEAKVYIDTRSLLKPVLKGLAIDSDLQLDTARLMQRTLLVRPNLESVARKTDLDLEAKTPTEFEQLLTRLARRIQVSGTGRDNIFSIRYASSDPERAARVVEALLNIFVERSLGDTRKDSTSTRQFVETQIAEYESRLVAAEDRLKEFKRRNVGLLPGSGKTYFARLEEIQERIAAAKLEAEEARQRRDQIRSKLAEVDKMLDVEPPPGARPTASQAPSPLEQRVATLQGRLDDLRLRYTDRHPDVRATERMLEDAKRELEEEASRAGEEEGAGSVPGTRQAGNPMYQELSVALSEAEGELAALKARVEEYEAREKKLRELVDTVPRVEAELKRLNRDYDVNKANYDALLQRREALSLANEAGQQTDTVQFNIIEPPRVPLVPIGPDRPILSAGVLVAGLGTGVLLALGLALLRPGVYTREEAEALLGVPVLGSLSRLWTRRERWRRRLEFASFAAACTLLVGIFGALLTLYQLDIDIVSNVLELRDRIL